jgi:shikimate dehydrogenase
MPSLGELRRWVADETIAGFNVTLPYKRAVLPLLDALGPEAEAIGAVNCVVVGPDGRLVGHNTDGPAFRDSLAALGLRPAKAFVLGTGGAASAVAWALRQLGIPHRLVSRQPENHPGAIAYADLLAALAAPAGPRPPLVVNATPLGTWPDVGRTPLPALPDRLRHLFLFDLVYNPSPTRFMQEAALRGATTSDGLEMLRLQAEKAWRIWGIERF